MTEVTADELTKAIVGFGNYRVLRTQQFALPTFFHPSVVIALGMRESGLKNICGGAKKEPDGTWVATYDDRGCFQIASTVSDERKWLESVPGCENGHWGPADPPVPASTEMHVPRFTDALVFVLGKATLNRRQALLAGVKPEDVLRFVVAAHNAGFTGALNGYRDGNVDEHTARGDYSAWVMQVSYKVHDWIIAHPHWRYIGQPLGHLLAPDEPAF